MTFRTTVQDGLIVINTHGEIPDGTVVEVLPVQRNGAAKPQATKRGSKKKSNARGRARVSDEHPLPGFGSWKHRTDIVDTAAYARDLRKRASIRKPGR